MIARKIALLDPKHLTFRRSDRDKVVPKYYINPWEKNPYKFQHHKLHGTRARKYGKFGVWCLGRVSSRAEALALGGIRSGI